MIGLFITSILISWFLGCFVGRQAKIQYYEERQHESDWRSEGIIENLKREVSDIKAGMEPEIRQRVADLTYFNNHINKDLESKVVQWFQKTKDPDFKEFFEIEVHRQGVINPGSTIDDRAQPPKGANAPASQ